MDFGGTTFAGCTSKFLADLREVLGFTVPDDRDPDGNWPDEQIMQYFQSDLRLVQQQPPLVALREIDPDEWQRRIDQGTQPKPAPAPRKELKNGLGEVVSHHIGIMDADIDTIKKIQPKLQDPPKYFDWMIAQAKDYRERGFATCFFFTGGYFEWGCWGRGFSQFCMDIMVDRDLVRALWDVWEQEKLHRLETVIKPLAPYVDVFLNGDDFGMQNGPFISPEVFRDVIAPYYKRLYGKLKDVAPDSFAMHHSCGSIYKLLDDLIDMGVEILNPIQPSAADMEPEALKEAADGRICFHGGIDLQHLLPFGTPDEVRAEATRRMKILGNGGGYICAPAHSLPTDVPPENIIALFEAPR